MSFRDYARLIRTSARRAAPQRSPHDLVSENFVFTHGLTPSQLFGRFDG
ncbi:MAG: hypothetical protein HKN46_00765 [Acidimicrobiia bacterium]|nr:hypothetical protein [Acidimicrobiia bacterium]